MTQEQLATCLALGRGGFEQVRLPESPSRTPIPGLLLFTTDEHRDLLLVRPDGNTVDLLELLAASEDCVWNWHKGSVNNIPQFVGDFGRLLRIAHAIEPARDADAQMGCWRRWLQKKLTAELAGG